MGNVETRSSCPVPGMFAPTFMLSFPCVYVEAHASAHRWTYRECADASTHLQCVEPGTYISSSNTSVDDDPYSPHPQQLALPLTTTSHMQIPPHKKNLQPVTVADTVPQPTCRNRTPPLKRLPIVTSIHPSAQSQTPAARQTTQEGCDGCTIPRPARLTRIATVTHDGPTAGM